MRVLFLAGRIKKFFVELIDIKNFFTHGLHIHYATRTKETRSF